MAGYTPVFGSVFDGTLCGQWPDVGVWVCLLAMADKNGHLDMTPQRIALVLGIDVPTLEGCIERFMGIDPSSRSSAEQGRRLCLIDPARPWGWRIVNFHQYREKARKAAFDALRVESGLNAERMRARKPKTRGDPRSPAPIRSQTQTQTQTEEPEGGAGGVQRKLAPMDLSLPDAIDRSAWADWVAYRREHRFPMSTRALKLHIQALLPYPPEVQREMVNSSINSFWKGIFPPRSNGSHRTTGPPVPKRSAEMDRAFEEGLRRARERDQ
jgi:hypothetical protein